ncbi:Uncharacterised protein r2_g4244 [Pycnogonum litorale]
MSAGSLGYVVTSVTIGYFVDKSIKPEYLMILGGIISNASFLFIGPLPCIGYHPSLPNTAVFTFTLTVSSALMLIPSYRMMTEIQKKHGIAETASTENSSVTMVLFAYSLGLMVGPVISGSLNDAFGFRWAAVFFISILSVTIIFNSMYFFYQKIKLRTMYQLVE